MVLLYHFCTPRTSVVYIAYETMFIDLLTLEPAKSLVAEAEPAG
jgi:hypothetical protein